jgi:hypothetical protein
MGGKEAPCIHPALGRPFWAVPELDHLAGKIRSLLLSLSLHAFGQFPARFTFLVLSQLSYGHRSKFGQQKYTYIFDNINIGQMQFVDFDVSTQKLMFFYCEIFSQQSI